MNASVESFHVKGQRLKDLEHFLAVMRARYTALQVRSDNEEALKHVLKDACEKVHLEHSNTRLETPALSGRGEHSVRAMKEMIQREKDAVVTLGIESRSNMLSSRCWCDTKNGLWITWFAMIFWLRRIIV